MLLRLFWNSYTRSSVLKLMRFLPVKKGRLICVCWGGKKYNCNPRAITDALLKSSNVDDFHIIYAFYDPEDFNEELPLLFESIKIGTLRYFYLLATSHFIIANTRFSGIFWPFSKKRKQIYIQTQHGGHGIKKVELDVKDSLTDEYIRNSIEDTRRIDLMLSDSKYWTNIYRTAYQYKGEVLEKGLPRNDIFFADNILKRKLKKKLLIFIKMYSKEKYSMALRDAKFLIYTPTFRANGRRDVYGFNVDKVINAFEKKFTGMWYVLVSSHPNMLGYYKEIYDFSHPRLIDVGGYPELQELLVISDALITDYSSAEMDFSLTGRPVFQLIRDKEDYDRGTYLDPRSLPFPYAEYDDELVDNIDSFEYDEYSRNLKIFNTEIIGLNETGHASDEVVKWILKQM